MKARDYCINKVKTCGWTKSFQCRLKRKSLRSTRKEIFCHDVLGVSGKPLLTLCIHNKCYCAEIKRAAAIHQRARGCCSTEPTRSGSVILWDPICHQISFFSFLWNNNKPSPQPCRCRDQAESDRCSPPFFTTH